MNDFMTPKSLAEQGQNTADKAAETVQDGIQTVKRSTNEALDKMADKAEELRRSTAPMLEKATDQAQKLMQQGRQVVQDTTQRVRDKAADLSDMAISYTKDEPVKTMLIAAAAGALLMGLVTMMSRSRR